MILIELLTFCIYILATPLGNNNLKEISLKTQFDFFLVIMPFLLAYFHVISFGDFK